MSDAAWRLSIGSFPATALAFAGLALVGFTGGAGTALLMDAGSAFESDSEVSVHPATNQAGLTATPTTARPLAESRTVAEPATSTAPAKSESQPPPDGTPSGRAGSDGPALPAARAPVAPPRQASSEHYQPAPAPPSAQPQPPPPPPAAPTRPPAISIPLLPVNPPPVIEPKSITIR